MAAIAPGHVGQIGGNVLLLTAGGGVCLSELVEAETIKRVGVGVVGLVEADGVRRDTDLRVGGDEESVRETEVFAHEPLVGDWQFGGSAFDLRCALSFERGIGWLGDGEVSTY